MGINSGGLFFSYLKYKILLGVIASVQAVIHLLPPSFQTGITLNSILIASSAIFIIVLLLEIKSKVMRYVLIIIIALNQALYYFAVYGLSMEDVNDLRICNYPEHIALFLATRLMLIAVIIPIIILLFKNKGEPKKLEAPVAN